MSQQELLVRVAAVLDELAIACMLSGSLVSSLQGEPRSSHDVDVVVALAEEHVIPLTAAFPPPRFPL